MSETTIRESTTNHMNTRGDTNTKEINITDSEKRHHKAEQHGGKSELHGVITIGSQLCLGHGAFWQS